MAVELDDQEQRDVGRKARAAVLDAVKTLGGEGTRRDILERALREGGFTERELSATPPTIASDKHETFAAYRLSWALTNLKRDGLLENPRWGVWRLSGAAAEPDPKPVKPVSGERLAELRAMSYREYLRTREWRRTRAAALERANHRCALDRTHTDQLEVHHNTYDRIGSERLSDLVVLCHACHSLHHQANGRPRRQAVDPLSGTSSRTGSMSPPAPLRMTTEPLASAAVAPNKRSFLRRIFAG